MLGLDDGADGGEGRVVGEGGGGQEGGIYVADVF